MQKQISPASAVIVVLIVVIVIVAVGYTLFLRKRGATPSSTEEERQIYEEQMKVGQPADTPVPVGGENAPPAEEKEEGGG